MTDHDDDLGEPSIAPLQGEPLPPAERNIAPPVTPPPGAYLASARWRIRDFFIVFVAGVAAAVIVGSIAVGAGADEKSAYTVFAVVFPAQVAVSLIVAGYLSAKGGTGNWVQDVGLRLRLREVWGLVGGVGLQIAALIVTAIVLTLIAGETEPDQGVVDIAERAAGLEVAFAMLSTVVLAPLVEEVLYRGILLSALRRHFERHAAVFISAAVFALVHLVDPGTLLLLPGLFLVGTGFGYAALRSQSLSLPLFLHAGVNLTGILLARYADDLVRWAEDLEEQIEVILRLLA